MKKYIIICFSLFIIGQLFAQSKAQLENQRVSIQKEIEQISNRLKQTREDRKEALANYLALQRKIQKRSQLINTLQQEDQLLEKRVARTNDGINSLEEDAKILQQEYGVLLRQALRQKLSDSYLSFIFSAKDFNEALKRWRYLNQYRAYRARQTQIIKDTQKSLIRKKETLNKLGAEKAKLLKEQIYQQEQLNVELERKNKLYKGLKKNESALRAELKDQQEEAFQLKSAILNLIGENKPSIVTETTGDVTKDFQRGKKKLSWPIRTESATSVLASFGGKVAGKFTLPNGMQSVLIKHGEFYTVYSNMDQIFVSKGDLIQTNQELGTLSPTDRSLHFEIWRQKVRLNPMDWLAPL